MPTEPSAPRRKLSAIVMVDVSGFSRMMGRDEEGTTVLIREFHDRTLRLVESHEGRVVDTAGDSVFGMSETIVGGSLVKPIFELPVLRWLNLSLRGEVNGRFVDLRGQHGQSAPSIETVYTDTTAPGLGSQPGFLKFLVTQRPDLSPEGRCNPR